MSRAMPDPVTSLARFSKQNELLSPTSAAVVYASEQRAAKPGLVLTGALRVKVIQIADFPGASDSADRAPSPASSWLRRRHANGTRTKGPIAPPGDKVAFHSVCVLLRLASSTRALATSSAMRGSSVFWNEEFFFDNVSTTDELRLVCVDRAKNEPYYNLPLRCDESVLASPGFVGKVHMPLVRLPEAEEIEQWYPLVSKESFTSLRTAIRVSVCFTPFGGRARSARAESSVMVRPGRPPPLTMTQITDPAQTVIFPPSPLGTTPQAFPMSTGILDYAIVVGPHVDFGSENVMLFRYPVADRPGFPLPTKIEWFCFPGGPEAVEQVTRPRSKVFSFVLVGGSDGLSRSYAVCVMMYHRPRTGPTNIWQATCIAFLSRLPLIEDLTTCLLSFAHTWITSSKPGCDRSYDAERLLVELCYGVLTPVRGVLGVEFSLPDVGRLRIVLPTDFTIYQQHAEPYNSNLKVFRRDNANANQAEGLDKLQSPKKAPPLTLAAINHAQVNFQPLVYSLLPLFEHFDVRSIIEVTALMLCEYRVLLHSTQMSVLSPIAEGLCSLIYPFRWQHPYVPILPSVLSEYLQAPLPYILGVNSSWLPDLLENGRPEHLVIVDIDRGSVQRHDSEPLLPLRLARALHARVNNIVHFDIEAKVSSSSPSLDCGIYWSEQTERLIRGEFVCFLATMLKGYRDCLFFVNQNLPVFDKRRFFALHTVDNEATPFLTRLFCTQAFQAFLESHDTAELNVFHTVYSTLLRSSQAIEWPQSRPPCLDTPTEDLASLDAHKFATMSTPVYQMPDNIATTESELSTDMGPNLAKSDSSSAQTSLGGMLELALDSIIDPSELLKMRGVGGLRADVMDARFAELMNRSLDYHDVASALGVDHKILELHSDWLRRPHEVNQRQLIYSHEPLGHSATALAISTRMLSKDEERIEQLLHKCLTSVFTSDDQLTQDEEKQCKTHFKNQYARDLFVIILMQPSQHYATKVNSGVVTAWYNPKGSGSCLGDLGFHLLARLSENLLDQCNVHEDFTNARGMLQVATQYYHFVEDKHSGIGVAKKEYLVQLLRIRPICRSLDMWQHAFSKEIDAVLLAGGTIGALVSVSRDGSDVVTSVSDEIFFSVIGSLVYDMLSVEVPVGNVQTFVTVMCSTYQKDSEVRDTLRQLVENVFRAVELSKDTAASPLVVSQAKKPPSEAIGGTKTSTVLPREVSPGAAARPQYDLDTVIRRKMSVQEGPPIPGVARWPPTAPKSTRAAPGDVHVIGISPSSGSRRRGPSNAIPPAPSSLLCMQNTPVLCLSAYYGRVACGLAEPQIIIADLSQTNAGSRSMVNTRLDGHTDAVITVQMQGQTLISGSRDHTLRVWDLKASPRKRSHIFGFLSSSPAHGEVISSDLTNVRSDLIDGATVSRKSLVMKGHTAAVTCLEIGRQLSTDRAIVASGSMDATIRLWDTSKDHSVAVLGSSGGGSRPGVSSLRYLAHFDNLVSGTRDEFTLKWWDLGSTKLRSTVQAHRGCIREIHITGDRLVTAANDRVAKVWDARFRDGSYSHALRGHGGPVLCLSLGGPADPNICTGSADGIVRVWDLRYVQKGPRLALAGHLGPVTCLQRDFTRLVSGSEDGSLRVWDMQSGVCLGESRAHQSGVTSMLLQDSSVFSGSWDGSVRVWDIDGTDTTSQLRT